MAGSNEITVDLTEFKDRVGSRIAPGRYRVIVDDAETETARSGNEMILLFFRVLDGEFANSTVVDRLVLTPNSLFRVVGFMQALGLPTPRKRLKVNLAQFKGRVLEVDVEDGDPYNGRVKSEVRGYMRSTTSPAAAQDLVEEDDDESSDPLSGLPTTDDAPSAEVDLEQIEL